MSVPPADGETQQLVNEVATFLAAAAMVLRDAVARFEETAARITEHVTGGTAQPNRHLIVIFQDFDRLQQEFAALADVLSQVAAKSSQSWQRTESDSHPAADAIARVPIADLKERLRRQLDLSAIDLATVPMADEVVF
jgi:hypothetical protein